MYGYGYSYAASSADSLGATLPVNETPPVISPDGTVIQGNTVERTSAGTWSGNPAPSITQIWQINGDDVPGETGNLFNTSGTVTGDIIRLRETAANDAGSVDAFSNTTEVVPVP